MEKVEFMDQKFKITISTPNETDKILFLDGGQAHRIANKLTALLNPPKAAAPAPAATPTTAQPTAPTEAAPKA